MRYAFFGSPEFAAIVLQKLIEGGMPPALVVANPDKPAGRKKILTPPPTKTIAKKHGIEAWQPVSLKNQDEWRPNFSRMDFGIVAAYAKIIPEAMIDMFPKGIVGAHPSLLPKHRGPSPIQSAILEGDAETGATLFLIDKEVDHGPALAKRSCAIMPRETAGTLTKKLAALGADLLIEAIPGYVSGAITPKEQDHAEATFTKKFTLEDAFAAPEELRLAQKSGGDHAIRLDRKIRALNPEPGVWTFAEGIVAKGFTARKGKRVKILEASLAEDGKLALKKIQLEGKMPGELI